MATKCIPRGRQFTRRDGGEVVLVIGEYELTRTEFAAGFEASPGLSANAAWELFVGTLAEGDDLREYDA